MSREVSKIWRRKDWDEELQRGQERFNQSVANLAPRVEEYEEELSQLYVAESPLLEERQSQVVDTLDNEWDHDNDTISVIGSIYMPRPLLEQINDPTKAHQYVEAIATGPNHGFTFVQDAERERVRLGLYIPLGRVAISLPGYSLNGHAYASAPLDEASFTLVRQAGKEGDMSYDPNRTKALLMGALKQYDTHILNPHSSFYDRPADTSRQLTILDSIASLPNRELPHETSNETLLLSGRFPQVYSFDAASQKIKKRASKVSEGIAIEGKLRGFTTLDCLMRDTTTKLRSPSDLIEPNAGIVAGVEITRTNVFDETVKQLYYTPIRLGSGVQLETSRD